MIYRNVTDEPIRVGGPILEIAPGETADLTPTQARSPQAKLAIRHGRLVAEEE